ncbi:MAG: hypothetical protein ACD_9C00155G0004 [uncultured bacterium]|nr:MAG: hypothetical protein ACD_9C00155G0004 [uncultured bacterium]KKQ45575.1 MAG: hypothetical protein US63_C0014G0007 [Candidatus Moranbacteria bacterium GW2011_GWC2_37_8]KKQ62278.1 MAG: hypothetical protein US82_C0015G0007 [Parcubacteria group bacterium GW2011_GWC1_38_22]KKQ81150.1 MAG: hypothetical protein UT03_C0010G0005 [Candidatus Moranbacteria bacterium GW2011_GWD2_38_7]
MPNTEGRMEKFWRNLFFAAVCIFIAATHGCGKIKLDHEAEKRQSISSAKNILDLFAEGVKRETLFVTKRDKNGKGRVLLFCDMPTKEDVRLQSVDGYELYPLQVFAYLVERENVYPPGLNAGFLNKISLRGRNRAKLMRQFKAHEKFVDIAHLHRES